MNSQTTYDQTIDDSIREPLLRREREDETSPFLNIDPSSSERAANQQQGPRRRVGGGSNPQSPQGPQKPSYSTMGPRKVVDRSYYDLMGIDPSASEEDIKRAYRRKALQLHPDKRGNSPEAQEEFTRMKQAYDVLSDPNKREIYDNMGEDGLKVMEEFDSLDPETFSVLLMRSFLASSKKARFIFILVLLLVVGFMTLFPILLCLWLDGIIHTKFAVVMLPLWLGDAIALWCVGFNAAAPGEGGEDTESKAGKTHWKKISRMVKAFCAVLLQIFVCLRIDGVIHWSAFALLAPWYAFEVLLLAEKASVGYRVLRSISLSARRADRDPVISEKRSSAVWFKLAFSLLWSLSRIVLGVLIALRIDGTLRISWWLVFLPLWLAAGMDILKQLLDCGASSDASKKKTESEEETDQFTTSATSEDSATHEEPGDTAATAFMNLIVIAIWLSTSIIIVALIQGNRGFSAFYAAIPIFIVIGLVLFCVLCQVMCMTDRGQDQAESPHTPNHPDSSVPYYNDQKGQASQEKGNGGETRV